MKLFDKIKQLLSPNHPIQDDFDYLIEKTRLEHGLKNSSFYNIKVSQLDIYQRIVSNFSDKKKVSFLLYNIEAINKLAVKNNNSYSTNSIESIARYISIAYIECFLKAKLFLDEEDINNLVEAFIHNKRWHPNSSISDWPVNALTIQIERQFIKTNISNSVSDALNRLKVQINQDRSYDDKEQLKIIERIDKMIFKKDNTGKVKPVFFLGKDLFSGFANNSIQSLPDNEKAIWYKILSRAPSTGTKPSNKFLADTKELIQLLGEDKFKPVLYSWFEYLITQKSLTRENYQGNFSDVFLSAINIDSMKGFVWMSSHFSDNTTLQNISKLAERCYQKDLYRGSAAASLGNACFYVLYNSQNINGIGFLSRLKLRIKQTKAQILIQNYIQSAADRIGVSTHEIEEMAVDDFDIIEGEKKFDFEGYTCSLKIIGVGKTEIKWLKPDGSEQKTVPSFIKTKYADEFNNIKNLKKQIEQTIIAQRDRIDRLFRVKRALSIDKFKLYYLSHGLMSILAKKIIWIFSDGENEVVAIFINDQWSTLSQSIIDIDHYQTVSLWHPAVQKTEDIRRWRSFLMEHEIQQPLKQAFREVYLLTDAELNTGTYSNRMAAHVLKQHQFNMLAKSRGWKFSLMGCYDDGRGGTEAAEISLPDFNLKVEFWVNEINSDDAFNEIGIWNYIATDQIRFVNTENDRLVPLAEVLPIPFSEVLRDIDLFIGVASVGNDPTWQDSGGIPVYRDYWTSYSFGNLSEVAKNRKEILTGLIPRLRIANVTEIVDKFVVVHGKLRTYKIHIGSTNILMEPNDQYLCIVPDRSQKNPTENLFIPFEGDAGLSIILSKALLLANDDKITDSTIMSQIRRK